uniref:Uncharacterized protein n=1 Tax=Anas zonorhyncha TaxID=75864 RepID=A0A8B9UJT8_9AVES
MGQDPTCGCWGGGGMGGGPSALASPSGVWASAATASASALEAWEQRALGGAQGVAGVQPPLWGSVASWLPPLGSFPVFPPSPVPSCPQDPPQEPLGLFLITAFGAPGVRVTASVSPQLGGEWGWGGGWRVGRGFQGVCWVTGKGEWDPLTCPAHTGFFHEMVVSECQYRNGTERVRFLERHIYNRQQFVHYDSDVGHYVADTELGKPDADYWNSQPELLEQLQAEVDRFCRHNYKVYEHFILTRRGAWTRARGWWGWASSAPWGPGTSRGGSASIPVPPSAGGKNGQEETKHVVSTDVIQNGDWTYQVLVMLESTPQHGDTYECHVQHASLKSPITYEWGKALTPASWGGPGSPEPPACCRKGAGARPRA